MNDNDNNNNNDRLQKHDEMDFIFTHGRYIDI